VSRYRIFVDEPRRVAEYVASRNGGIVDNDSSTGIGLERDGEMVAGVMYDGYLERSICIHVAAQYLTRAFVQFCFQYAFGQLGVLKLIGLVDSDNTAAMLFNWHLGFEIEAVIKDAAKQGDLCIFTMTREQCKWLNVGRRTGVNHGWQEQRAVNAGLHWRGATNSARQY